MTDFICPVCSGVLKRDGGSLRCPLRHCFDISRYGYVNLLPSGGSGKRHGDDKLMVRARSEFLDNGHYDPLSRELCRLALKYCPESPVILDAGCGEGKYTADMLRSFEENGRSAELIGIDISKDAVTAAYKRCHELKLAVASSAALPLADGSADMIMNVFSPLMPAEFHRVLSGGGILLRVIPLKYHLWELKELIYDVPYPNDELEQELEGFTVLECSDLKYSIHLSSGSEIMALFSMTPYYYKTGAADQAKAARAEQLDTGIEFRVIVYRNSN